MDIWFSENVDICAVGGMQLLTLFSIFWKCVVTYW